MVKNPTKQGDRCRTFDLIREAGGWPIDLDRVDAVLTVIANHHGLASTADVDASEEWDEDGLREVFRIDAAKNG